MYFASEPCNTLAVSKELAKQIRKQSEHIWLALVDNAFDYGKSPVPLPNARQHLYECDGLSDLLGASPCLITLTAHDEKQLEFELVTLIRHRKERPMLSFICTSSSAYAVNDNFRKFSNAVTNDDQDFLFRFADTRVLPGLPNSLRPAYWDGMTSMLSAWIVIDRDGRLSPLPLNADRTPLQGRFQLSPAEFTKLVTNSEADAVLDAISEGNPEALPDIDRATLYCKVARACSFARQHNVLSFRDLVALAYLVILSDGNALENAKLSEMLMRSEWESGRLINHLAEFIE